MTQALSWWFVIQFVGLLAFPLAYGFFRRVPDRGWAFSKPFGILFLVYLFWILNSAHILPNDQRGVAWALFLLALPAASVVWRRGEEMWRFLQERWRYVLLVEGLFTLVFAVGGYLRSFVPDVTGTEKPMDFAFINAVSRAENFPPADPWLSGHSISYYYFGHLMTATLGKLSAVPTSFAFNLGLVTVAALAATAAFGVAYNLVAARQASRPDQQAADGDDPSPEKEPPTTTFDLLLRTPAFYGVVAAALVAVFANLEGVLEMTAAHGIGSSDLYRWLGIEGLADNVAAGRTSSEWYPTEHWFWWRATRIIGPPETIAEFPFFSFLLGDMHPHVMAIPFVLMMVGAAFVLLGQEERLDAAFWVRHPFMLLATGVMVGGLLFLNTWDMPTFAFLVVGFAFLGNRVKLGTWDWGTVAHTLGLMSPAIAVVALLLVLPPASMPALRAIAVAFPICTAGLILVFVARYMSKGRWDWGILELGVGFAVPLLVVAAAAYIPFYGNFSSQAAGFRPVMDTATRPLHTLIIWGPLAVLLVPFVWQRLAAPEGPALRDRHLWLALAPGLLVVLVWAFWVLWLDGLGGLGEQIADRRGGWITAAVLIALLAALLLALWREVETVRPNKREGLPVLFALGAAAVAVLLVLGAEFIYVRDVFGTRMNTVFKLYYQAWLLLAATGGFALYRLASASWGENWGPRGWRITWVGAAGLVLIAALVYPVAATFNRANESDAPRSLDGLAFARRGPDFGAIDWLMRHVDGTAVVAETVGGSYQPTGRVSAWTGLTTPIGWPGHESQWRCKPDSPCPVLEDENRFADMERLYSTTDEAEARAILDKYGIDFVFVGSLERQSYPEEGLVKFERMLPVAYQDADATVYRAAGALEVEGGP